MSNIAVVVRYIAQPDKAPDALTAVRELVATVLAKEPACAGIEILQDIANPESITLIERWPDQATFLGPHMQQPHIQAFIQSAGAFLAGPPDISFHSIAGAA
ncbi:putative quinol monooxygenase [Xanthomonadaceae bacterium JHOS43]|nr:putative quinol monooxygenase [Xanthomonadaceae bacterium JHOS43]MCX7562899.1 putative quinol monooxygenase [Xanthomonadaceae bacterium XH05]